MSVEQNAARRIQSLMKFAIKEWGYEYENPSDMIADIIHYCDFNSMDFKDEVRIAKHITMEDVMMDKFIFGNGDDDEQATS